MIKYDNVEGGALCQVGGNPHPIYDGCLASVGAIRIDDNRLPEMLTYTYDETKGNTNARTIQKLSKEAQARMYDCENCPYSMFDKFHEYYGMSEYGDEWITAAFEQRPTAFPRSENNNRLFSAESGRFTYDDVGRAEAIKIGTAFLNIWMAAIGQMERALDLCNQNCDDKGCNVGSASHWDNAVAHYAGAGTKGGSGDDSVGGHLLYGLANKRCQDFKTCGESSDSTKGIAWVNIQILHAFNAGLVRIKAGQCGPVRSIKERIEALMLVPLIQSVLRFNYLRVYARSQNDTARASATSYAAAVLPAVSACNETGARIIAEYIDYDHTGEVTPFTRIKAAFEQAYACMGIDGTKIGGIWNATNRTYSVDAEPYVSREGDQVWSTRSPFAVNQQEQDAKEKAMIFFCLILIAVIVGVILGMLARTNREGDYELVTDSPDGEDIDGTDSARGPVELEMQQRGLPPRVH